ncbi:MAG: group II intron reverse transcriptase/maturase [Cyanobacteria bacterium SBC]|nr:group II intron reverse transcriptase/maturase [Cyanobacteria bacterium SBC]
MTELTTTDEWKALPWRKLEKAVFKLQKRIYRATERGDVRTSRRLQRLLLKSRAAKLLAVRRVTQDNRGKKTAGIDGKIILSNKERLNLARDLKVFSKGKPTRRVWIPKPGKTEKRPLGIPTIYDRALQMLVKMALEPEWEVKFESNSYGFRPGRSTHDAVSAIFNATKAKSKFILDADLEKCFDRIDHQRLLEKVNTFPQMRRQIKSWLKSGVLDNGAFNRTETGTPQGGVISPLLANIALHGMEERIKQTFPRLNETMRQTWFHQRGQKFESPIIIRYADDFVVIHENRDVIVECQRILEEWLGEIGLSLKREKTRIAHTLLSYDGQKPGFDFLGFNIRQYPKGKHHSSKSTNGKILGFKLLIKPSEEAVRKHYRTLSSVIDRMKAAEQGKLIHALNPIIRGWSNYYRGVCSKEVFSDLDNLLFKKLIEWSKRRHPNKNSSWSVDKYWQRWNFTDGEHSLVKHRATPIKRHIKVRDKASPYDGNLAYWSQRISKYAGMSPGDLKLFKRQNGKCALCGLYFKPGDLWEIDHIIPKRRGGKSKYSNLQVLHRHCHDFKSRAYDKGLSVEEPCERKLSRTVLKTSSMG